MIKWTVKYKDPFGEEDDDEIIEEDLYFNYSRAELIKMEMSTGFGLAERLLNIGKIKDRTEMFNTFHNIIVGAYGVRSEKGRRFIKNDQVREDFLSSEAYSALLMELLTDTDKMSNFINGIIPRNLEDDIKTVGLQAVPNAPRVVTQEELKNLSEEDMRSLGVDLAMGRAVIQDDRGKVALEEAKQPTETAE